MARRRKKRSTGAAVFTAIAGLVGLFFFSHPALRHEIAQNLLLIGVTALAIAGFLGVTAAYLRSGRATAAKETVSASSDGTGASAKSPATTVSRRAFNELWSALVEEQGSTDGSQASQQPAQWTPDLLKELDWKRFEELCAGYFEAAGGLSARTTRLGADGGIDICLYSPMALEGPPTGVIQCKGRNTYKVGVKPVRELYGVMAAEKARFGIFMTTGNYTGNAKAFAADKRLQLLTGEDLLDKLRALPPATSQRLLAQVTVGDYTTPTCPRCGVKMTRRTSRKEGQAFWGCVNYPRCRHTLRLSSRERGEKN